MHDSAAENVQQEVRQVINAEAIFSAMTSLGFENYSELLKVYLSKYREWRKQEYREWQQQQESHAKP